MRLFKLISILVVLFCYNCNKNKRKDDFIKERIKATSLSYQEYIEKTNIPKSFYSHFPMTIKKLPIKLYSNDDLSRDFIYVMLFEYEIDKKTMDSLSAVIKNGNIVKYSDKDLKTLVINKQNLEKEYINFVPYFETHSYDYLENVVSTKDVYSDRTKTGLSENFDIYIFNTKSKDILSDIQTLRSILKQDIKGYSRGICINTKKSILIYWFLAW